MACYVFKIGFRDMVKVVGHIGERAVDSVDGTYCCNILLVLLSVLIVI